MLKVVIGIGLTALAGAVLLAAHLYLGVEIPGLDPEPKPSKTTQTVRKTPRRGPPPIATKAQPARSIDQYSIDDDVFSLAKRTAATIGRRGQVSAPSLRLYKDVVIKAERACRFRNIEACWHRGELAKLAREGGAGQWAQKTKTYAGEVLRRCAKPSKNAECVLAEAIMSEMRNSSR